MLIEKQRMAKKTDKIVGLGDKNAKSIFRAVNTRTGAEDPQTGKELNETSLQTGMIVAYYIITPSEFLQHVRSILTV